MKKILMFAVLGMFLISFASATLTTKLNEDYNLEVICINNGFCSASATCEITVISQKTNTEIIQNELMQNNIYKHNLTISNLSLTDVGEYTVTGICTDVSISNPIDFSFYVTLDGSTPPEGNQEVVFSLIFLIIIFGMLGLLMYTIFKMIEWDFDGKDLIYNVSLYFTVFAYYIISKTYLNNAFIDEFIIWLIGVGAFTTVILPIIAFFMNYVKGGLKSNE